MKPDGAAELQAIIGGGRSRLLLVERGASLLLLAERKGLVQVLVVDYIHVIVNVIDVLWFCVGSVVVCLSFQFE